MSDFKNVETINPQNVTVESILIELLKEVENISTLTVIVGRRNASFEIEHSTLSLSSLALDSVILNEYVSGSIPFGGSDDS